MGYTHYWRRKKKVSLEAMRLILEDFLKTIPELRKHIDLAGSDGFNEPILSLDEITFNGRTKCGHEELELGITWPSENAGGVAEPYKGNSTDGSWFAGANQKMLRMR